MLSSFVVRFLVPPAAVVSRLSGFRMAAAFLELVRRYDRALAARLHDEGAWPRGLKPYTVSAAGWAPEEQMSVPPAEGRVAEFRITLLRGDLLLPVLSALVQHGRAFAPGRRSGRVCGVELDHRRSRWAGSVSAQALWENAPQATAASVLLASPTAFRRTGDGVRSYVAELDPRLLVGSLVPKWDAYVRVPLDPKVVTLLKQELRITACADVRLSTVEIEQRSFLGITGVFDLEAPDMETGRLLHALSGLAFYAGIGIKTPDGMGQTLPLPAGTAAALQGQTAHGWHDLGAPGPAGPVTASGLVRS